MNWTTVEDAIHAWIVAGSGLAATQVIWGRQAGPRPDGAYIEARISVRARGLDWDTISDNPTPSAGAEIVHTLQGPRECTLTLQAFDGDATGAGSGVALLNAVIAARGLPSVADALDAADVGILRYEAIQDLDLERNDVFESRAVLVVHFQTTNEVSETGTYIEYVKRTGTFSGSDAVIVDSSFDSAFSEAFS